MTAALSQSESASGPLKKRRRREIGPLDYCRRWWLQLAVGLTFVLLYAPVIVLVVFSFNDSRRNIVWRGFTTKYYEKALENDSLIEAFYNSLTIAVANMVLATVLGVMVAMALWRFRSSSRRSAWAWR